MIPEQNAVVYDPGIPYEQAAMFEPATVAIHGVFRMIIRADSMLQYSAAERSECLQCSGARSSDPRKL